MHTQPGTPPPPPPHDDDEMPQIKGSQKNCSALRWLHQLHAEPETVVIFMVEASYICAQDVEFQFAQ